MVDSTPDGKAKSWRLRGVMPGFWFSCGLTVSGSSEAALRAGAAPVTSRERTCRIVSPILFATAASNAVDLVPAPWSDGILPNDYSDCASPMVRRQESHKALPLICLETMRGCLQTTLSQRSDQAPGARRRRAQTKNPNSGTDQRLGVSFDQQDGSAVGGWARYGVIGAYAHTARHAVKCAEWCRTQDVAWRSSPRTGRAGFRLR